MLDLYWILKEDFCKGLALCPFPIGRNADILGCTLAAFFIHILHIASLAFLLPPKWQDWLPPFPLRNFRLLSSKILPGSTGVFETLPQLKTLKVCKCELGILVVAHIIKALLSFAFAQLLVVNPKYQILLKVSLCHFQLNC